MATACLVLLVVVCLAPWASAEAPIDFEDMTKSTGLAEVLEAGSAQRAWRYAHGAGWGDVDGDGRPELYVGAFAARAWFSGADAPRPNVLLWNRPLRFVLAEAAAIEFRQADARCSGVLFADLDNDGDLDLLVANHVLRSDNQGSRLFENRGGGKFRDVTPRDADWPSRLGIRNVSALDVNGDGRLDLLMADGSYDRRETRARLLVLENLGGFRFAEASAKFGLPASRAVEDGLAIGDVNEDGVPDIFVAGSNRLFVSDGQGRYREAHPGRFAVPTADEKEGMHCGAALADLNGDGLLDLVTTEHGVPARIHVFQHRGVRNGLPDFVEVSDTAGVGALFPRGSRANPIKAAHVALRDADNDGRPDVYLSLVYRADRGRVQPVVLRNLSTALGGLRFTAPPYDKILGYYAAGPAADYDRDGRVDVFLASWFEHLPNYLFRNVTAGGNWITIRVVGDGQTCNTMGLGAVIRVYQAGRAGDPRHLLGRHDVAIGTGYASCEEALAHLGLGTARTCDVEVTWGPRRKVEPHIAVNRFITVNFKEPGTPTQGARSEAGM